MSLWQKYRPGLDGLKGNSKLVASLRKMFASPEHPHAFLITAPQGAGKAQPLYSKVLTPAGWKTMGEIAVGDEVVDGEGQVTKVLGVFPQGKRPVYSVRLEDGTEFRAADNHLHRVQYRQKRKWPSTKSDVVEADVTTLELIHMVEKTQQGCSAAYGTGIRIPVVRVQGPEQALPIDPYLLGVLIGDGSLSGDNFAVSLPEADMRDRVAELLQAEKCVLVQRNAIDYYMKRDAVSYSSMQDYKDDSSRLRVKIKDLGLNVHSIQKHIPSIYLQASWEQRLALLQGLFDTDGTINVRQAKGHRAINYEYYTSSPQLAEDVAFLARSLGLVVHVRTRPGHYKTLDGEQRYTATCHMLHLKVPNDVCIVRSQKNLAKRQPRQCGDSLSRKIKAIEYIGEEECQCIYVEASCHTYVTDNVTVTHNTSLARSLSKELLQSQAVIENNSGDDRGVDAIRALTSDMQYPPLVGRSKVLILDEAHKLTPDAKSALLKPVEEAKPWAYYIFCTPDPEKLFQGKDGAALKTRLTVLKLQKPSEEELSDLMREVMEKEGFSIPKSVGLDILSRSGGNPREALKLLEQARFGDTEAVEEHSDSELLRALCGALLKGHTKQAAGWREVSAALKALKEFGADAENIRRVVLGYAQSVALKSPSLAALDILDLFTQAPVFEMGFPAVTTACMKVCWCS